MPDKKEKPTPARHTVNTEPSKSLMSKLFTPLTDAPSRMARDFSTAINRRPEENSILARAKGFVGGAAEGAGNLLSDMTSPVSLATMAIPAIASMRRAGRVAPAITEAIAKPDIPAIDITPEFGTGDDAFQHYWEQLTRKTRGLPEDIPNNPVAQNLERERRAIERGMPPERVPTEGDKKISNLQAQFRRSQMKRVK